MMEASGAGGYLGVYHVLGVAGWDGPTGFYRYDQRAAVLVPEGKHWSPIHMWADPSFSEPVFWIEFEPWPGNPPDRHYTLELLYVPPGVVGAPPVGTVWTIPPAQNYRVELPPYRTTDGMSGYRLAFDVSPVDRCIKQVRGDSSCDWEVDFGDINYFVAAVRGEAIWRAAHGGAPTCDYVCTNDINEDDHVDFADISPFVDLLTQPAN